MAYELGRFFSLVRSNVEHWWGSLPTSPINDSKYLAREIKEDSQEEVPPSSVKRLSSSCPADIPHHHELKNKGMTKC